MLLSAAMCLYCNSDSSGGGGRFAKIGELLDNLIDRWPALIEQSHRFVETLIDGLPNSESRWLWRLQVNHQRIGEIERHQPAVRPGRRRTWQRGRQ